MLLPYMVITYLCFPRRAVRAIAYFPSQVLAQEISMRSLPNSMDRKGETCREDLRHRLRLSGPSWLVYYRYIPTSDGLGFGFETQGTYSLKYRSVSMLSFIIAI